MNSNRFIRPINSIVNEVIRTATSKELLKKHLSVPLYRNAYYLMTGTAITSVTGFVFWMIAARFYPVEAVGLGFTSG